MAGINEVVLVRALLFATVFCLFTSPVLSDTPANCTFEDIAGTWVLYETPRNGDHSIDCLNNSKL